MFKKIVAYVLIAAFLLPAIPFIAVVFAYLLTPYEFRIMESLVAALDWYFRHTVHPLWYWMNR